MKHFRHGGVAAIALIAAVAAKPASALTINPTYDASITSLVNASVVEAAFNSVATRFSSQFDTNATVNVRVSWGSVGGVALPSGAVGASSSYLYGYFGYPSIRTYLTRASQANPANTALARAVAHLPTTTPAGVSQYVIPSSEAKVLGIVPAGSGVDSSVGFGGNSVTGYTYDLTNGVKAGTYDFQSAAAHEIDEALGRISGLYSASPTYRTVFDLFRYKSPGVLSYSYTEAAYFSIDGGATNLGQFNASGTADRVDWLTTATSTDIQDAFLSTGQRKNLTAVDLTGLDVLGYGTANLGNTAVDAPQTVALNFVEQGPERVPEPGSLAMLASMLGVVGAGAFRGLSRQ